MIRANISRENKQQIIVATGSIPEMVNDVAVLLNGIYNQFNAASPAAAKLFRKGVEDMVKDPNGTIWKAAGNQTGIAFTTREEESNNE